jgi:hypothetical protein
MIPTILLSLLLATPPAVPIPYADVDAVSVTNRDSTLVAWTHQYNIHSHVHAVYVRLIDSPHDRNAVLLDRGYEPKVATNGREYLVGYTIGISPWNLNDYDNVAVQRISREGIPIPPRRILNRSRLGSLDALAWNGRHWLAASTRTAGSELISRVTWLDEDLNVVATADVGFGSVVALEKIGGRWWAVRSVFQATLEAIELRDDGMTGARFPTAPMERVQFAQGLFLAQNGNDVDAIPFDPALGFGERRRFVASAELIDTEGSVMLVRRSTRYDAIELNASGEIVRDSPLHTLAAAESARPSLGAGKTGLLFFNSPHFRGMPWMTVDLFAWRVHSFAPLDPLDGELISQVSVPQQRRRSARH